MKKKSKTKTMCILLRQGQLGLEKELKDPHQKNIAGLQLDRE